MPNLIRKRSKYSIPLLAAALAVAFPLSIAGAEKAKPAASGDGALAKPLKTLLAVEPNGVGNAAASEAWEQVAQADAEQLPVVLAAMDQADPLATNWLASAVETIADRTLRGDGELPTAKLEKFVLDKQHAPHARRLAFEWLVRADKTAADRLTPGFLYDPSPELRREAVARLIDEAAGLAKTGSADDAHRVYDRALSGACDLDQVKKLKEALEKLGEKVDLARHFGFITRWELIGPFDNTGEKAFDVVYPPEEAIDLGAEYQGKPEGDKPRTVGWIDHETKDEFGIVDLNEALAKENGVVAYAYAEFDSPKEQPAELRLGRDNAAKVWLNGKLIHEHRVYHSGSDMDQYIGRGKLKAGRNTILVKVLQNEQKEEWAQTWGFQLRVCDATGVAIRSEE